MGGIRMDGGKGGGHVCGENQWDGGSQFSSVACSAIAGHIKRVAVIAELAAPRIFQVQRTSALKSLVQRESGDARGGEQFKTVSIARLGGESGHGGRDKIRDLAGLRWVSGCDVVPDHRLGDTDANPEDGPMKELMHSFMAIKRHGRPEEVAGMVAWLSGPEAGFVTGAMHTIDGAFGA
jgi:hypothetical protein